MELVYLSLLVFFAWYQMSELANIRSGQIDDRDLLGDLVVATEYAVSVTICATESVFGVSQGTVPKLMAAAPYVFYNVSFFDTLRRHQTYREHIKKIIVRAQRVTSVDKTRLTHVQSLQYMNAYHTIKAKKFEKEFE